MSNTTAVLVAAAIGVISGVAITLMNNRHQTSLARIERRHGAYVDALRTLNAVADLCVAGTVGVGDRQEWADIVAQVRALPDDRISLARASIRITGSAEVIRLNQAAVDACNAWIAGATSASPTTKEGLAELCQGVLDKVNALADQMKAETG